MNKENLQANEVVRQGGTMERIHTGYTTAVRVQVPRELVEVNRRIKDEALVGGESFYYGWGAGKDQIEGPSIHLAMAAARCWGKCAVDLDDVQDLGDSWVFTAVFIDVETGFTLKRQFRQSKTSIVYGKHDEERKTDIRFQIGQSKAVRNVVVNAIPKHIITEAVATAKKGVRKKIEDRIAALNKEGKDGLAMAQDGCMDQLKRVGVTEEAVLRKLGRPTVKAITVEDLIILMGDIAAISDGSDRADGLYPEAEGDKENATNGVMDHLGGDEEEDDTETEVKTETEEKASKKAAKKAPKSKSEPEEPEPPTDAPPEEKDEPVVTQEQVDAWAGGSLGPFIAEQVLEIKSRFSRLGDDPGAMGKRVIDWKAIADVEGSDGVGLVRNVLEFYKGLAAEASKPEGDGRK